MASVRTLLTVEDALRLPDRDDCRYELDEGVLIELTLPRPRHQMVVIRFGYALEHWCRSLGSGCAYPSDTPFLLHRNPDTLRGPDIAWLRPERAATVQADWVIEGAPDLAIEVASPSDRITALLKKVSQYLEAGSEEVWLVMPSGKEIHVYRSDRSPRILRTGQTIESPLLSGFSLTVDEIFN